MTLIVEVHEYFGAPSRTEHRLQEIERTNPYNQEYNKGYFNAYQHYKLICYLYAWSMGYGANPNKVLSS
jgi:hypothetical protein